MMISSLLTIAVITSGCWIFFGIPSSGAIPSPYPVVLPPSPSPGAYPKACWLGTFELVATHLQPVTSEILNETRTIIENRLHATGVPEAIVKTTGANRITVELPLTSDTDRIEALISRTGRLDFVAVPTAYATQVFEGSPLPPGMDPTPMFSGDQISAARPGTDQNGRPAVDIELKADGARIFDDFAATNFTGARGGVRFAIVLDGIVQSALGLNTDHFGGVAQIVGNFTDEQVADLATVLTFGSLPLGIHEFAHVAPSCPVGI
jgi:preprotein translocase subunit SecD